LFDKLLDPMGNPGISNSKLVLAQDHANGPGFHKFSLLGLQFSENIAVIHLFRGTLQSAIEVNPQRCILFLKLTPPLGTGLYQRRFPLPLQREILPPFTRPQFSTALIRANRGVLLVVPRWNLDQLDRSPLSQWVQLGHQPVHATHFIRIMAVPYPHVLLTA